MTSSFPLPPVFCSNKGEYSAHIRCDCSFNKIAITSVGLPRTSTTLFAHHVNKKITKRMMDRRPKKSRPSDINRNNQNHGKCITKMDLGPDYTLLPAAGRLAVFFAHARWKLFRPCRLLADFDEHHQANMLRFWEEGSPEDEWIELTEEDMKNVGPSTCQVPPINDGTPKNPPIRKNGWGRG